MPFCLTEPCSPSNHWFVCIIFKNHIWSGKRGQSETWAKMTHSKYPGFFLWECQETDWCKISAGRPLMEGIEQSSTDEFFSCLFSSNTCEQIFYYWKSKWEDETSISFAAKYQYWSQSTLHLKKHIFFLTSRNSVFHITVICQLCCCSPLPFPAPVDRAWPTPSLTLRKKVPEKMLGRYRTRLSSRIRRGPAITTWPSTVFLAT